MSISYLGNPCAEIKLSNYRCFEDGHPVTFDFSPGFTAFVGPNNSGKSALIRSLYELRTLFEYASHPMGNFTQMLNTANPAAGQTLPIKGVKDNLEIFCDRNSRNLALEITLPEPARKGKTYRFECTRQGGFRWVAEISQFRRGGAAEFKFSPDKTLEYGGVRVESWRQFQALAMALRSTLYVGPYRNAVNAGGAEYFDLQIGSSFIKTWNQWKTGDDRTHNRVAAAVTDDIARIFEFDRLEINAAESLSTLQISINGNPYKLEELGAGIAQFIIVFMNAAIKRPAFILIDEPELHLHPSLQVDFLTSLGAYASHGVLFSTHQFGLARATADRLYSLRQESDGSVSVQTVESRLNYAQFLGEMSYSSYREMGCDRILLVEGVSDVRTVQQFLRLLGKEHKIVVLPLGGGAMARGGVEQELAEVLRVSKSVSALVDSERASASDPPIKDRQDFEVSCNRLGIQVHVTQLRAIENYFTDSAVKGALGSDYAALSSFERLKDAAKPWGKKESWRIARQMTWDDLKGTDLGPFLRGLS